MYFNDPGRARSKALYKRNRLGSCSCCAFIASSQDVPAFKTGVGTLTLFRDLEWLPSLAIRKTLPFSIVFGFFLLCLGVKGVLSPGAINIDICDSWEPHIIGTDTKETLALNNVLQSFRDTVRNSWVDAFVDSQILLRSWNRHGSRSHLLVAALKCLFETTVSLNIDLHVHFIPGPENPADSPSRRLSFQDLKLSPAMWGLVQDLYGGHKGHSIDLTARASNVQTDLPGNPLPFFSESLLVNALGVDVFAQSPDFYGLGGFANPYVFPPICPISQIFKYLNSLKLPYTLVVPDVIPQHLWWPLLLSAFSSSCMLAA